MEDTICYRCNRKATNIEHVPAKCFFPKDKRLNLITVPSCITHNNETSIDDEYVRGVLVSCSGNNDTALKHWRGMVRNTFLKRPKLFLKTFKTQNGNSFFHDRIRIDNVMIKISYALYFKEYGKHWKSKLVPYYENLYFDNGKTDIEVRLPNFKTIPPYNTYLGANPDVFKYYFLDGKINNKQNSLLRFTFYDGFRVLVLPEDNS
jgi:hypothetical protein